MARNIRIMQRLLPTTHRNPSRIESFLALIGKIIARKYEVLSRVGEGWEGEVYLLREIQTGILRAAKIFYPQRNLGNQTFKFYAKKLHKLRHCPVLIQYHTQETIRFQGTPVLALISEYVEGEMLSEFLKRQPGGRIGAFQGLHLLHAMAKGIEPIHAVREYHGDLHTDNVLVQSNGLGFELKVLDFYHWKFPRPENIHDDVVDMIKIFFDAIGGAEHYARMPKEVKDIVCGLKKSLITAKFKTAGRLREYLETMAWEKPRPVRKKRKPKRKRKLKQKQKRKIGRKKKKK